jgi:hypothetical protein
MASQAIEVKTGDKQDLARKRFAPHLAIAPYPKQEVANLGRIRGALLLVTKRDPEALLAKNENPRGIAPRGLFRPYLLLARIIRG